MAVPLHRLAEARRPAVPPDAVLIVPVGSLEQHGPHLPLATDTLIASAVADGIAASVRNATVAPPVSVGASGEHQGFAGTLSIGNDALRVVLVELVRSAHLWAGRTLLVNAHGGNGFAVTAAVTRLRREGHDVVHVPCAVPGGDAHAGRTETSLLLHLAPHLVDLDAAVAGVTAPIGALLPRLRAEGVLAVAPNGVLGDPTGASAEEGAVLLAAMIRSALERLEGRPPPGSG